MCPDGPWQPSHQVALVGLYLYVSLVCAQTALTTLYLRPPGPWQFTRLLGALAIKIILALLASIGVVFFLLERGEDSLPVRISVDLATDLISLVANPEWFHPPLHTD